VVLEVAPSENERILHTFKGGAHDGEVPYGGVVRDTSGDLVGTT
jgi:hypothetical protein